MTRPALRLRAFALRLCPRDVVERFIDPAIADLQYEHAALRREHRAWRARCVRVGASLRVLHLILWIAAERVPWFGMLSASIGVVALVTSVLIALVLNGMPAYLAADRARLVLLLLPSSLPVAVPCGVAVAAAWPVRGMRPHVVIVVAAALAMAMLADVGWIVPAANQAFREMALGHPLARGFNEMTTPELWRLDGRAAAFALNSRLAIAASPIATALLAIAAIGRRGVSRVVLVALTWFAYFTLHVLLRNPLATLPTFPPALIAWLPNLTIAALALALSAHRRSTSPPH